MNPNQNTPKPGGFSFGAPAVGGGGFSFGGAGDNKTATDKPSEFFLYLYAFQ